MSASGVDLKICIDVLKVIVHWSPSILVPTPLEGLRLATLQMTLEWFVVGIIDEFINQLQNCFLARILQLIWKI